MGRGSETQLHVGEKVKVFKVKAEMAEFQVYRTCSRHVHEKANSSHCLLKSKLYTFARQCKAEIHRMSAISPRKTWTAEDYRRQAHNEAAEIGGWPTTLGRGPVSTVIGNDHKNSTVALFYDKCPWIWSPSCKKTAFQFVRRQVPKLAAASGEWALIHNKRALRWVCRGGERDQPAI